MHRTYNVTLTPMFLFLRPHNITHLVTGFEYTSSIRNDALHDLTLIKLIVARFLGTGVFKPDILNGIRNKHIAD